MNELQILGLQLNLHWEDAEANRKHIENLLTAHAKPADIIVLPEMFTTGFSMNALKQAEEMMGPSMYWMRKLAQQQEALILGSLIILEGGKYYNRFIAMDSFGVVCQYDKRHTFRMAGEHEVYEAGQERKVFEWKGWRICPQVCYDLRFPVFSRTRSDENGPDYDLLIYVANWPKPRISHWETLLKARAIENQAFVIGINRVGTDGVKMEYNGGSVILDHMGNVLAQNYGDEVLLEATLDPGPQKQFREKFPVWKDADEFEVRKFGSS
jgi:predicted amidohydrolase